MNLTTSPRVSQASRLPFATKNNLRLRNNHVERLVYALRPSVEDSPERLLWEEAMAVLAEQFRAIIDLPARTWYEG